MKLIVQDSERAFLFKNGVYKKMLEPGKHWFRWWLGESKVQLSAKGKLDFVDINLPILRKDPAVERSLAVAEVPDGKLALHFVDGRIADALRSGTHAFWNIFEENTFELIDISDPQSAEKLPAPYVRYIPKGLLTAVGVSEGTTALLYYDGVFQRTLPAGEHMFWNYSAKVAAQIVDLRVQQLEVSGQEIVTADKVSLRINFVCSFRVNDPVNIIAKFKDYNAQIYSITQLVIREFIGKYRFDELLRQKDDIGGFVLEKLKEREGELFVNFLSAGLKDIILPGEIRDIMNTVLVAEKSAQASVIARREEIAATKSLLDTVKLMDENTTLFKLKELEYLERICDKVGNISVEGGNGILQSLRDLLSSRAPK